MAHFQQYHQQASGPAQLLEHPARDEVLSPLPLSGMQQLYEDRVTPPTPPVLEPFIAPARPSHQGAFPSLTPAHNMGILPTPSSTMSYLSIPSSGSYDSPYNPFTSSFATSPSPYSQPSCMGSPGVASPSTYYSFSQFNSPGMASGSSYYSLSPTSPAMQIGSAYCSPAQAGPSTLPSLPYFSVQPSPATSAASTLLPRVSIPQTVDVTSKWHRSFMERFSIGGIPGIPVREVVKDCVAVDRADERVLVKTGARQIRLVIAWPGYKHHGTYIPVQDDQGFITRGQLAKRICTHLSRFVKRIANEDPSHARTCAMGDREEWLFSRPSVAAICQSCAEEHLACRTGGAPMILAFTLSHFMLCTLSMLTMPFYSFISVLSRSPPLCYLTADSLLNSCFRLAPLRSEWRLV
ncbi:hypothetical protein GY45DRAFT_349785 [Cubamyces sp. BRFM 1775]|nr:hypothetical protein GY45DRAFT_349785 [Cubamyces sp. BRFM 1775]